jgi:hypothetical protein|tara:strand:+ start:467 stop:616 length:150 start_codon:yes stop_codon:yes gene_type:complete
LKIKFRYKRELQLKFQYDYRIEISLDEAEDLINQYYQFQKFIDSVKMLG